MQEKNQNPSEHHLLIRPVKEFRLSDLLEIFRYRELLYFLYYFRAFRAFRG
jgi:hypothetical protein